MSTQNRILIKTIEDLTNIKWDEVEKYDFRIKDDVVKRVAFSGYLDWWINNYINNYKKEHKYKISQNMIASKVFGISSTVLSQYKLGERLPRNEALDNLARVVGPIVYSLLGVQKKLPDGLEWLPYLLGDLTDEEKTEFFGRTKSLLEEIINRRERT